MREMMNLQFTLFAIMAAGVIVKKAGVVSDAGKKSVTNLVIDLVLPCNIVTSFLIDLDGSIWADCGVIFLISLALHALCVFYGKLLYRRHTGGRQKCLRYGIICSNAGVLGSLVAEGAFGARGLLLSSIYLIPLRVMMWSEGVAVFSDVHDAKAAVKRTLRHPCVVACLIGLLLMLTGIEIPPLLLSPIQTIAKANTALSMLVIGMILAEINFRDLVDRDVLLYTLQRLIIIPLILFIVLKLLHVEAMTLGVSVLLCAMPAGSTTAMLAQRHDSDPKFATKMVVFSTLCSIPAICLWTYILA